MIFEIARILCCITIGWIIAAVIGTKIGTIAGSLLKKLIDRWE